MRIPNGLTQSRVAEDRIAGVAAEGDRDHRGDDRVHRQQHPRQHPGEVPFAPAAHDVLEEATGRGVPRPQLGEGVALEHRDDAGEHEGDPDGSTGHLPGRAQQCEDAGPDHGADPDERGVADGRVRAPPVPAPVPAPAAAPCGSALGTRGYLLAVVHDPTVTCDDSPSHHPRGGGACPPRRGARWATKEAPHVHHRVAGGGAAAAGGRAAAERRGQGGGRDADRRVGQRRAEAERRGRQPPLDGQRPGDGSPRRADPAGHLLRHRRPGPEPSRSRRPGPSDPGQGGRRRGEAAAGGAQARAPGGPEVGLLRHRGRCDARRVRALGHHEGPGRGSAPEGALGLRAAARPRCSPRSRGTSTT